LGKKGVNKKHSFLNFILYLCYNQIISLMNTENIDKIAKIDNTFILNAQYRMTAKEQKVLYYLISHLNPKGEKDFNVISVPIKHIEETLKEASKKWGSLYEEIERLCDSMITKNIKFPSNVIIEGKALKGRINFFSSIRPLVDENGQTVIKFSFSPDMKPFLLQLHHYVNIGVLEVVPMKNTHAIRMYSIFKSERDRLRGVRNIITMTYTLKELKAMLGIEDKYLKDNFKDFRIYVLDKIRDDINETCPTMVVKYDYIKAGRKITGVVFTVCEKKANTTAFEQLKKKEPKPKKEYTEDYAPNKREVEVLNRSKKKAFEKLVNYGIFDGIAYKQIIPTIKGSEFEGYEDIFIEKALQHFEKTAIQVTTKELKASTFVTWWVKNKVYETGDVWADILEKVVHHKKELQKTNPTAFENRQLAKSMTNGEFEEYIKKMQE
jgi:Initiator Replication protein